MTMTAIEPEAEPAAPAPVHPKRLLIDLVNDPVEVRRLYESVTRFHPVFPQHGATPLLGWLLALVKLPVDFDPIAERMANKLWHVGWRVVSSQYLPHAGDLWVANGEGGHVRELGVVAKAPVQKAGADGTPEGEWFRAFDHTLATRGYRPYRRLIDGDDDHQPVAYWLTYG